MADHGIVLGIGTVTVPRGSALVRTFDGVTSPVRSGDKLANGETIETTLGGEAVITYDDQSTYTLGPGTSVTVDQRNLREPTPEGKVLGRRFNLNRGTLDFDTRPNPAVQSSISSKDAEGNIVGIVEIVGSNGRTEAKGNTLSHTLDTGSTRMINPTVNIKIEVSPGRSISFTMNFATQEVEVNTGGAAVGAAVGQIGNAAVQIERETTIKLKRAEAEARKAEKEVEKALREQQKAIEKAQKDAEKQAEKARKETEREVKKAEAQTKKAEADARKTEEAKKEAEKAEAEAKEAEDEFKKAEAEAKKAEQEAKEAKNDAEKAEKQAEDQLEEARKESQEDRSASTEQKEAEKVNSDLKRAELEAGKAEREAVEKKADAERKGDEQSKKEAHEAEMRADDLDKELKARQGEPKGHERNLPKRVGRVEIRVVDGRVRVTKDGRDEEVKDSHAELDDDKFGDKFDEQGNRWGGEGMAVLRIPIERLPDEVREKILAELRTSDISNSSSSTSSGGSPGAAGEDSRRHDAGHALIETASAGAHLHFHIYDPAFNPGEPVFPGFENGITNLHDALHMKSLLNWVQQALVPAAHSHYDGVIFAGVRHDAVHNIHLVAYENQLIAFVNSIGATGPGDFHSFIHALLEGQHIAAHLRIDNTPSPGSDALYIGSPSVYSAAHGILDPNEPATGGGVYVAGSIHQRLQSLHGNLHSMPTHDFLHLYIDEIHCMWHREYLDDFASPCAVIMSAVPPGAEAAHQHFHESQDAFHQAVHGHFGIP